MKKEHGCFYCKSYKNNYLKTILMMKHSTKSFNIHSSIYNVVSYKDVENFERVYNYIVMGNKKNGYFTHGTSETELMEVRKKLIIKKDVILFKNFNTEGRKCSLVYEYWLSWSGFKASFSIVDGNSDLYPSDGNYSRISNKILFRDVVTYPLENMSDLFSDMDELEYEYQKVMLDNAHKDKYLWFLMFADVHTRFHNDMVKFITGEDNIHFRLWKHVVPCSKTETNTTYVDHSYDKKAKEKRDKSFFESRLIE